jgi:lysyl-tRNA synthetase class 1
MASVTPSQEIARAAHAWPFEEARKVLARVEKRGASGNTKDYVLFETGYGPSGLPHIGTFGEVARTTWVRRAFEAMSGVKTRLISFSDDMDGLRKVPGNVPNQEMLHAHLGQPLTAVPDPFGTHESYGAHNNARLRAFLDRFGFDYEFLSSTDCYKSGRFDAALLNILQNYEKVRDIVLPIRRSCRCLRARVPCSRFPFSNGTPSAARSCTTKTERKPKCRSRADIASCNGKRIGRCAGKRSASTTKWPARI